MAFHLLNLFLSAGASSEVATNSAVGMIGSFLAAGATTNAPAPRKLPSIPTAELVAASLETPALRNKFNK